MTPLSAERGGPEQQGPDALIDFSSAKTMLQNKLKPNGQRPPEEEAAEHSSEATKPEGATREANGENGDEKQGGIKQQEEEGKIDFGSMKSLLEGKLKFRGGGSVPSPKKDAPAGSKASETTPPTASQGPGDEAPLPEPRTRTPRAPMPKMKKASVSAL